MEVNGEGAIIGQSVCTQRGGKGALSNQEPDLVHEMFSVLRIDLFSAGSLPRADLHVSIHPGYTTCQDLGKFGISA
jgi:hypothetical protein